MQTLVAMKIIYEYLTESEVYIPQILKTRWLREYLQFHFISLANYTYSQIYTVCSSLGWKAGIRGTR